MRFISFILASLHHIFKKIFTTKYDVVSYAIYSMSMAFFLLLIDTVVIFKKVLNFQFEIETAAVVTFLVVMICHCILHKICLKIVRIYGKDFFGLERSKQNLYSVATFFTVFCIPITLLCLIGNFL